ncbi:hypothetical protein NC651_030574 [Populus alba x Populus x berolinensis]|nr:hypothetical protein NC651_030574 [Populus alba x Populus x berolinensis]
MALKRGNPLHVKAYAMADVLSNSIYDIVYALTIRCSQPSKQVLLRRIGSKTVIS